MGSVGGHGANILVEELKRREEADMISTPDDQSNALLVSLGSQNKDSGTTTPDEGQQNTLQVSDTQIYKENENFNIRFPEEVKGMEEMEKIQN